MALGLGTGFSGVVFPIAVAVSDFLKLIARFIEQGKGFGSTFDSAGFRAAGAVRHLVASDDRLTNRWSAAKGDTYYTNDAVGNLTGIKYPASGIVTFSYDALNRRTTMVDGVGTTT